MSEESDEMLYVFAFIVSLASHIEVVHNGE